MSAPPATPALRRLAADAAAIGERLAFWVGIALPCIHLPLLAVYGVTAETAPALLAFWTVHAAALLVGRRHSPDGGRRERTRLDAADDHRDRRDRPTDS
ncbi:hypothetical protein [Halosimplex pelagicum]|uniref:Uncharacterized protein n=1 Tax=Halosimplex pelagicum TaxID=869886 RepID=A0A7D5P3Q6_9EURY|nr:hypothetical protein [Halosimplex pelagicum]QLH80143.1 hypothetical protein HZS54_00220 [Halosimplex pelagicum]